MNAFLPHLPVFTQTSLHAPAEKNEQILKRQIITQEHHWLLLHIYSLSPAFPHTQFLTLSQCHSPRLFLPPPLSSPMPLPPIAGCLHSASLLRQDSPTGKASLHLISSALIIQPFQGREESCLCRSRPMSHLLIFFTDSIDACWPSGYFGKNS